ncbi:MAG: hypothetical protein JWO58_2321 [Chitinophagaceae bacterium]|nr:hypothetical protein [Chitinophagaceae bacterium]
MKYLSFDLRALACMRIGVAFVLMLDLLIRLGDLEVFYSNTGVVPLDMLFRYDWNDYYISVHTISGLWQVELVLFFISFVCAAMLCMGYRTQLFTVLSWFMLLSLHNRNSLILQGGDDLLRMVLFWAMFIPWGARYSYDRIANHSAFPTIVIPTSVATFAYMLQLSYLYTGSALLKGPEWNSDFTALYYTYSLDQISYSLTSYLYYHPLLLKELTRVAYYFELLVPILFFLPFAHSFFRSAAVAMIIGFHAFNGLTLFIGLFPLIGMVTILGVLPSSVMDKVDEWMRKIKPLGIQCFSFIGLHLRRQLRWKAAITLPYVWRQVQTALLIFLMLFVFDWNFSNLSFIHSKLSDRLRGIGYGLRLDQSWGMFAPGVFKDDGWYVLKGIPEEGIESFDLLHPDKELTLDKPEHLVTAFKNDRWRKYTENFIFSDHEFMRGYFCSYTKRTWNERHTDRKIKSLDIIYVKEYTLPDYQYAIPKEQVLWHCGSD